LLKEQFKLKKHVEILNVASLFLTCATHRGALKAISNDYCLLIIDQIQNVY
jgi:hypothetical protein